MKVIDGKISLSPNDHRVGNFVFTTFGDNITLRDINSTLTVKIRKGTPLHDFLGILLLEKADAVLANWATVMFNVNLSVFDFEMLKEVNEAVARCLDRHKDVYGETPVSDEEDAKIIEEEQKLHEALNNLGKNGEEALKS